MTKQSHILSDRMTEIHAKIERLTEEAAMLSKFKASLQSFEHLLQNGDVLNSRTATKFELLARVANYLKSADPFMYGGASTKEIYEAVRADLGKDIGANRASNSDPDRRERNGQLIQPTPMEANETPLNYSTFRSYLARFRAEGRIFFNTEKRRWRITEQEVLISDDHHDEDERCYD